MRIGQRVGLAPKRAERQFPGQRAKDRPILNSSELTRRGLVIVRGTHNESRVLWLDTMEHSWECDVDLLAFPYEIGDNEKLLVRHEYKEGTAVIRQQHDPLVDGAIAFGLIKPPRKRNIPTNARQLTLDIRSRIQHGMPTRDGKHIPDERKVALAAHAATGEPLLVRKGTLQHHTGKRYKHNTLHIARSQNKTREQDFDEALDSND